MMGKEDAKRGLYVKYEVRKKDTGELVNDCFVLRPDRDPAARYALLIYAWTTPNLLLSGDIINWLRDLEIDAGDGEVGQEQKRRISSKT